VKFSLSIPARSRGAPDGAGGLGRPKIPIFEASNQAANQAFAGVPNRLSGALKNHQKIPFIQ
jgi:hypothetical protein